jgi:hypothetical protein
MAFGTRIRDFYFVSRCYIIGRASHYNVVNLFNDCIIFEEKAKLNFREKKG